MARNEIQLSRYEADFVLMPAHPGANKLVKALRVVVYGPNFPQRAIEPELLLGDLAASQVSIAPDQRSIRGYFFEVPADDQAVRVRYGDSLEGELRGLFSRKEIRPAPTDCRG